MNDISLSVVIPTYNRKALLKECLESLFAQTYPKEKYEIVVVDDGSTDGTEELLKDIRASHDNFRYFRQEKMGPGAARNLGVSNSNGSKIVFINDDGFAPADFLKKIDACLEGRDEISACVGNSVPVFKNRLFSLLQKYYEHRHKQDRVLSGLSFSRMMDSNCCGIRKDAFAGIGGFDRRFAWAGEDGDLEYRLLNNGRKIYVSKDISVFHHQRDRIGDIILRFYKLGIADTENFRDHFKNWLVVFLPFEKEIFFRRFPLTACISFDHLKTLIFIGVLAFFYPAVSVLLIILYTAFGLFKTGGLKFFLQLTLYRIIINIGYLGGRMTGSIKNGVLFI